ncbi:hypothetical protein [Parvularcula marina]|uniref:Uncharacterized protein n=1 Tax=Parvularcula marina TaxID=2292771 RepID=A0A371RLD0_9PROT|nr:hypothetical protein [Parvularcula marina]RFB06231.1 hypothetical protein DX908_13725 [Parvularcula marina]
MATENIKTASEVIADFLDTQAKDESLDADTVASINTLWEEDDLSKVKLLRKLEEARKAAITADLASGGEPGDD